MQKVFIAIYTALFLSAVDMKRVLTCVCSYLNRPCLPQYFVLQDRIHLDRLSNALFGNPIRPTAFAFFPLPADLGPLH